MDLLDFCGACSNTPQPLRRNEAHPSKATLISFTQFTISSLAGGAGVGNSEYGQQQQPRQQYTDSNYGPSGAAWGSAGQNSAGGGQSQFHHQQQPSIAPLNGGSGFAPAAQTQTYQQQGHSGAGVRGGVGAGSANSRVRQYQGSGAGGGSSHPHVAPGDELIQLDTALPPCYRNVLPYPALNRVQSRVFEQVFHTNSNIAVAAPTGTGKTAIFELAILRLLMQRDGTTPPPARVMNSQQQQLVDSGASLHVGEGERVGVNQQRHSFAGEHLIAYFEYSRTTGPSSLHLRTFSYIPWYIYMRNYVMFYVRVYELTRCEFIHLHVSAITFFY